MFYMLAARSSPWIGGNERQEDNSIKRRGNRPWHEEENSDLKVEDVEYTGREKLSPLSKIKRRSYSC